MSFLQIIECSTPSTWDGVPRYKAPNATRSYDPVLLSDVPPPINKQPQFARLRTELDDDIVVLLRGSGFDLSFFAIWSGLPKKKTLPYETRHERSKVANAIARLLATREIVATEDGRYKVPARQ